MTDFKDKTGNKATRQRGKAALDMGNMVFGKVAPQSKDLEAAVLGAIMLEKSAFDVVSEFIHPSCFYVDAHQRIFKAMCSLAGNNMPIDLLTVVEELRTSEDLATVGGPYYVSTLSNAVVSSANIESHARIVLQKYIQRELIRISGEVIGDAYEDSIDVFDLLDETDRKFTELTTGSIKKSYSELPTAIAQSMNHIEELKVKGQDVTGIPTGFIEMDKITHGWQDTDLIILAARPAVGKTALALNIARNAAANNLKPVPVAFFSLEMSVGQLVKRLLSAESEVWLEKINTGNITDESLTKLYKDGATPLSKLKIYIDDTPSLTLLELRSKARNLKRKKKIGLIIIDYLQLMGGADNKSTREREISNISRGLKGLAKELKLPIIALSQLSRKTEERKGEDKMPQLSDLRESGAIEQDADMVMFLYRPEYYGTIANEMGESNKGETIVKFAKHRNGNLGNVTLRANLAIQKFYDADGGSDFKSKVPENFKPVKSFYEVEKDDDKTPF